MTMGIRFEETMTGFFLSHEGDEPKDFSFRISVHCRRLRHFWTGAPMDLEGTVDLEGISLKCPTRGTLEVDVVGRRQLIYELQWNDEDKSLYRFVGKKEISARHPIHSMTVLRGLIFRKGESIGTAELSFALRDLPQFIGGMRPTK
jgi:hypothetical protein